MDHDELKRIFAEGAQQYKRDQARIAALESQLAQYRWRRVDEELPERFVDVLVVDSDGWHFIAHTDSRQWLPNHPDMESVTHWMPIPPAPGEGE